MKNVLVGHKFNSIPSLINYTLLDKIGEGGHGYVYKAKQNSTGQVVAIKMLKFKENIDEQIRKRQVVRFERETQLCAEINHPNIVKLIDKGYTENKEVYAVYEYICGETLDEFIFKKKELTPVAISELMGQILEGLICAHTKGIVHRDLKPQNIMVNTNGSRYYIKILDFGIGTFTSDSQAQNSEKLTLTREIVGTPAYSAPEQLRGEPVTVKSDLYAWGLIFLECLTGQPVVKGGSLAELFQQQLSASNILVPATIAGHPLADLLRRVLEKKAEYRISSAEVVYEEYSKINFYSLVGELKQENTDSQSSEDITIANQFEWTNPSSHKRQITVVCIKLSLIQSQSSGIDLETLDTLQKDQLNLCVDTATRFGGYLAGKFTDHLMIYFGYPKVSDTDARRAGRTALELINQVQKRSTLLAEQHGISMSIRVSMNSGTVVSSRNSFPEGVVPNVAFNLVYIAKAGTILVSESTKKMLDPYLEFEATEACFLPNLEAPLSSYYLTGERKSEAFSFLRPWSAHRKMIGRDTELQQILKEWKIVTPQKGKAILIEGQAGIGKSKLLYECKINIEKEGYIVQECRCLPEHQNNALYPFLELLKKQLGIHTGMEDVVTVIPVLEQLLKDLNCDCATTMPVVCSWLSIPLPDTNQPSQETPERQKEILLVTLEKFLLRSKKYKKFVFVIEDLHWLDPTSQVFIEKMIGVASNCLLLMSIRPSNSVKLFSEKTHKISLQPLSDAVTKRFLEEMLHTTFITEEAIDYISNRADGVPLFIEELTQMLLSKNCLLKNDEMYKLAEKVDEKFIPVTLKGLLHARLDGLGLSKETAQLAATIGREFDYQLLIASSLQDEARVQTDLEVLIKANLIYQQRKVKGESYVFRHALIRDAAYDGMLTVYRREMHERVAKALEEESIKNNAQLLAFHFHQAKQPIKAIKYYQIAADQELQKKMGHQESLALTNKALFLIQQIKEDASPDYREEQEAFLYIHKAAVLTNKFGWKHPEIIINYKKARQVLKPDKSNPELEFLIAKGSWIFHCTKGNVIEMFSLAKKMLNNAKELNSKNFMAQAYDCLGQTQFLQGRFEECIVSCKNCYKVYNKKIGKKTLVRDGLDPFIISKSFEALSLLFLGEKDKAIQLMKKNLIEVRSYNWLNLTIGLHVQASRLSLYLCSFFSISDGQEIFLDIITKSNKILSYKNGSFPYWEHAFDVNKNAISILNGDVTSIKKYNESIKKWLPKTSSETYYPLVSAVIYIKNKNYKRALEIADKSIEFAEKTNITYSLAYAYCFKAQALSGMQNDKEAAKAYVKAFKISKKQKAILIQSYVEHIYEAYVEQKFLSRTSNFYN